MDTAAARLAEELRELRRGAGMSLKELERTTATSDSSLSRYLAGTAGPPWSVVEALCRAAGRPADDLRALWEAARRERLDRYGRATTLPVPSDGPAQEQPDGLVAQADPQGSRPRGRRRRALVVGAAVLAVAAAIGGVAHARSGGDRTTTTRLCPWHYVVTDGDPAPVLLADKPGPGRHVIHKTYAPDEVFLAPDPPQVVNDHLRTVDGWVSVGDWIRRAPGACVVRH